jgi:hypothetical protein
MPKSKVLVVTKIGFFDIDKLGASLTLTKALLAKHSSVDLLVPNKEAIQHLGRVFNTKNVSLINKATSNTATISLKTGDVDIQDVEWEQIDGELKIRLKALSSIPISSYSMDLSESYDQIYVIGISDKDEMYHLTGLDDVTRKETKIIVFDHLTGNEQYGDEHVTRDKSSTYAEMVYGYITKTAIRIDIESAEELLASLYWRTNSFRNGITTEEILKVAGQLISSGASPVRASALIYKSLTSTETKVSAYIYPNIERYRDVGIVVLPGDLSKELQLVLPIFPEKNPLYKIRDLRCSFVLLPISSTSTLVLGSSVGSDIDTRKLFTKYKYIGDEWQFEMTMDMPATKAKKEILSMLGIERNWTDETKKVEKYEEIEEQDKAEVPNIFEEEINGNSDSNVGSDNSNESYDSDHIDSIEYVEPEIVESEVSISEKEEGEREKSDLEVSDPLAPASEEIIPEPAPEEQQVGMGMGGLAGMGGMGASTQVDPLKPASNT